MIAIEAYRVTIGNFNNTAQLSLKPVWKNMVVGSHVSGDSISRVMKSVGLHRSVSFSE